LEDFRPKDEKTDVAHTAPATIRKDENAQNVRSLAF
jgi:hypothetical protein